MNENLAFKHKIPTLLVYSRLVLGMIILLIAILFGSEMKEIILVLLVIGFLTDVFDGIIARKYKIDSDELRRLDSKIDRIFWSLVLVSCYLMYPEFIKSTLPKIALIFGLELIAVLISYLRFKKYPAPHNYLSKLWGCFVLVSIFEIILSGSSNLLFNLMILFGVLSRIDGILIYSILENWERDIISFYHAFRNKTLS